MKITLNGYPVTPAELKEILDEFEDEGSYQKLTKAAQELLVERPKCTVTFMVAVGFLNFENEKDVNN
jgi:hypothetical protein